jgi:hypothetical protein
MGKIILGDYRTEKYLNIAKNPKFFVRSIIIYTFFTLYTHRSSMKLLSAITRSGKFTLPLFVSLWLLSAAVRVDPVLGAETIKLVYGPFQCSLPVKALETYAETGEVTEELKFYTKFLDHQTLAKLRYWLQKNFASDRVEMYHYTKSPQGEEFLQELGSVVTTHSDRNGFYAIRSALVEAAATEGWTVIDVMQQFPTENLQIDTQGLFKFKKFWQESDTAFQAN